MKGIIQRQLKKHIRQGCLEVRFPDGDLHRFGEGEPHVVWHIRTDRALRRIALYPQLMLGEMWMDGDWEIEQGTLLDFLQIVINNFSDRTTPNTWKIFFQIFQQWNRIKQSYRNISHHYDIANWFYRLFLDKDMYYTCAYFNKPGLTLEEAQEEKSKHITRKLRIFSGQNVLDIGCGWGALVRHIATNAQAHVTGITLSNEQYTLAKQIALEKGLKEKTDFILQDYREHERRYDRIVSVGMFEHVGRPQFLTFMNKLKSALKPNGIALLHTMGRTGQAGVTNPWLRKYIFPGGYIPALSEILSAVEKSKLIVADIEVLHMHYAWTLAEWQKRFQNERNRVVEKLGERFARMWEFYLSISEAAFLCGDIAVYQIQLAHKHHALPHTRKYIYSETEDS